MAVNASMSDDLAYKLTKIMLEKREDLALVHKEALEHQARVADLQPRRHPLASGRAQVLQGEGHQGRVTAAIG